MDSHNPKIPIQPLQRTSFLQADFQRKRATTACQLCRTRKTKCDNQRPSCSKCRELGGSCVYHDQANPASQILDRLDYLIQLVESDAPTRSLDPITNNPQDHVPKPASSTHGLGPQHQDISWDTDDTNAVREDLTRVNEPSVLSQIRIGLCEDILEWPIFEGRYDRKRIEALIFDPALAWNYTDEPHMSVDGADDAGQSEDKDPRQCLDAGRGVSEEDVMQLVEGFLLNVHIKNPIVDPAYLRNTATSVSNNGFGWKAQSCLVLIACALGAISSPFTHQMVSDGLEQGSNSGLLRTPGYSTAELYYTAARKRMGLLTNTLLATECYFLAGVYEMYSLRPLQASISFNRACIAFQTATWMKPECHLAEHRAAEARTSRLYWSCLKSEHEMSMEFRFPSSGLMRLNYTSSFPPPPATTSEVPSHQSTGDEAAESTIHMQESLDRGWYYYLADIAARRLLQRVIDSFYTESEVVSLPHLIQTAGELQRQLDQWICTLPRLISFDVDVAPEDELAYHLQARAFEVKERIYRPFLFSMIHLSLEQSERVTLQPFVQAHASTCIRLIQHWNIQHRHHGAWLMARQSFASALLLVAAQKAGLNEQMGEQCVSSVNISALTLGYWEAEAPDLKASRLILEDMIDQLKAN
ncbi:hypothetical protein AK830_g4438 [Neonectria ditissima]|uniref:Zn(2)-C6 fungal-type domain-containing protein n=1 Tax=Neonectria ditissima TaxID=78410 RepID=A0A0P7BNW8_9HYPO|nr:hypothetical protein AK830_g4438 [Neonectria ditissima]